MEYNIAYRKIKFAVIPNLLQNYFIVTKRCLIGVIKKQNYYFKYNFFFILNNMENIVL